MKLGQTTHCCCRLQKSATTVAEFFVTRRSRHVPNPRDDAVKQGPCQFWTPTPRIHFTVVQSPVMATPRHQSSLEGLIDFSAQPLFADADKRARVIARFRRIVGHLEAIDPGKPFNRPSLVRLTFEYARSPVSQDRFLAFFFRTLGLGMVDNVDGNVDGGDGDVDDLDDVCSSLRESVLGIAEFLITNFFLPREFILTLCSHYRRTLWAPPNACQPSVKPVLFVIAIAASFPVHSTRPRRWPGGKGQTQPQMTMGIPSSTAKTTNSSKCATSFPTLLPRQTIGN